MDMKAILQAMDNAASKPVEDSSDIKKFIAIINEGTNPHKVSLPVQMAMQHYSEPKKVESKPSLLKQYFAEAEENIANEKLKKRQVMNQYARKIAERVQMKEDFNANLSPNPGFEPGPGPGIMAAETIDNPEDVVKMDIPLLIRLLEYAREDAKTDMDLHNVAEKLIEFSKDGDVLSMEQYDAIVGEQKLLPSPDED
jgi:hypothetical protein